jgi:hypothetical protein
MKRFFIWGVLAAALLSATSCSKDEEENQPITAVVDFEGEEWKEFVALNVGSTYSSEVVTADYLWQDEATTLAPANITAEWDGVSYLSSGFAVSSFNSNCLEKFNIYGAYLRDLYVYNAKNEDAAKGGGNGGSDNFLVGYGNYEGDESGEWGDEDFRPTLTFADGKARTIKGCYVNSTTYFVSITELGNEFSPALQAGEKITLTATGYDKMRRKTGSVTMTLAEKGNITKSWRAWDLSALGAVVSVRFNITGGPTDECGMMSPKYFAIDDITVEWDDSAQAE